MTVQETMTCLLSEAKKDPAFLEELLATRNSAEPLSDFCDICIKRGYFVSVMDIVVAGEEDYDAMRRSINGGGGNHCMLPGESDPYEMLMTELEMYCRK